MVSKGKMIVQLQAMTKVEAVVVEERLRSTRSVSSSKPSYGISELKHPGSSQEAANEY